MIRTLIVDDDALVRATLPSLLDWESCGYRIVQDCRSGQQALDFLRVHDIDLLITDIKMPGMGGLKLLERLRESGRMPVSVVLSGYDEFELVREAFRLGAYDYLLKSNLSEASLRRLLDDLRHKVFRDAAAQEAGPDRAEPALEAGRYIPAVFSIRNFPQAAQRYGGDLREKMQRPMLELARQIPRLSAHAVIRAVDPSCYELYYKVSDPLRAQSAVELAVRQLQRVWKDMMNLEVAAGVGGIVPHTEVSAAIPQCAALCSLAGLREPGAYCTVWGYGELADSVIREVPSCEGLLDALFEGGGREGDRQAAAWFVELRGAAGQAHTGRCAALLVGLNQRLHTCGQSLSAILPEQPDLLGTLQRLDSAGERELWLHGVLRRVQAACGGSGSSTTAASGAVGGDAGASLSGELVFTIWDNNLMNYIDENDMVGKFQEKYPDAEIEVEKIKDDTEYWNAMKMRASANQLPDVMFNKPFTLARFKDYLLDLSDTEAAKNNSLAEGYAVDGKLLGVPMTAGYEYVYYWKDLFEEAGVEVPTTWTELQEVATALQNYYGASDPDFMAIAMGAKDVSQLGSFYLPVRMSEDEPFRYIVQGDSFMGVTTHSKNPELAKAFVEWFYSEDWYPGYLDYITSASSMSNFPKEKDPIQAESDTAQPDAEMVLYGGAGDDFTAIQNEIAFDYKKLGAQMFTEGFDLDATLADLDEKWAAARAKLGIQ